MCPTGQVIFQSGHVLIFPAVCISFTGLVQILAGHMNIFAGHVNFQNHVPDRHVNQMLNVNPLRIFRTKGHLLVWVPPHLALSCLALHCLVLPGFGYDALSSNMKNGIYMVGLF